MALGGNIAGAIRAGGAFVEIGGNTGPLDNALTRAGRKLRSFALKVAGFGAGSTALGLGILIPIKRAIEESATLGDQFAKMSRRTGIGVETLSELGHAANLAGSSIANVETSIRLMQRAMFDAKRGSAEIGGAFKTIGLDPVAMEGMPPEQQFEAIAEGIRGIKDSSTRAAVAMKLFGRSGTSLLPLIDMGAEGIREARIEAHRLGITFDTELAAASEETIDNMARLSGSIMGIKNTIAKILGPAFNAFLKQMTTIIVRIRVWMDKNRGLVQFLAKLGVVLTVVGGAALALAAIITVLSLIAAPLGVILALMAALATATGLTSKGWEKLKQVAADFIKNNGLEGAVKSLKEMGKFLLKGFLSKAKEFWIGFKIWGLTVIGDLLAAFENGFNKMMINFINTLEGAGLVSDWQAYHMRTAFNEKAYNPFEDQIESLTGKKNKAKGESKLNFLLAKLAGLGFVGEIKKFFAGLEPDVSNALARMAGSGAGGGIMSQVPAAAGIAGVIGGMDIREQLGGFSIQREQLNELRGIKGELTRIRENTDDDGGVFE